MKNIKKIWIAVIVTLLIIIASFLFGSTSNNTTSTEPIKIGFIAPLTGPAGAYGEVEKNAVEMALAKINASGELKRKLEIVYEDGKCSGQDAVTAAQKLINIDKVSIILGGLCSSETLAIAPLAEQNKVIVFSAFSSSPDITKAGDYIFRNSPSDSDVGKIDADYMISKGYKNVAIISENTDYSQGVRGIMKNVFSNNKINIVSDEVFNSGVKDFRTQLTKIKALKPEAIYINPGASPAVAGIIPKQMKELGMSDIKIFGNFVFGDKEALNIGGKAMEGIIFSDYADLAQSNASIISEYKTMFQIDPANNYPLMARYDSVFIINNAIKSCGGDDSSCIKKYLYSMKEYNGTLGAYRFDINGDILNKDLAVHKIYQGGVAVVIKN